MRERGLGSARGGTGEAHVMQLDHRGAAEHRFHQSAVALQHSGRSSVNTGKNFYTYRAPVREGKGREG